VWWWWCCCCEEFISFEVSRSISVQRDLISYQGDSAKGEKEREREGEYKNQLLGASGVTSTQPPRNECVWRRRTKLSFFFAFFSLPRGGRRSNVDKVNVNVLWFVTGQKKWNGGRDGREEEKRKKKERKRSRSKMPPLPQN